MKLKLGKKYEVTKADKSIVTFKFAGQDADGNLLAEDENGERHKLNDLAGKNYESYKEL
ncbi:hypothetical protein GWA97_09665 [Flavobacterium sp. LaA7.5]|nr:hypothetical protein [Flavobacterium salilacus subsp. altitudinum]